MEEALEVLETEYSYDGYFYRIKDAVIIVILGSLCELQNAKKIHTWATSAQIGALALTLAQETVQSKSNEIPAVQKLIKELEIAGCMVAADAH